MNKSFIKYQVFVFVSVILIAVDQITKKLALKHLFNNKPYVIIDNVLELTYVENRGAAFGILQNKQKMFYILTIIVLIVICYLLYKMTDIKKNLLYFIVLILIFSGAIGNFIDRLKNKYVIDFIYFKPIDFPVFNCADIYITIACFLMIIYLILENKNEKGLIKG